MVGSRSRIYDWEFRPWSSQKMLPYRAWCTKINLVRVLVSCSEMSVSDQWYLIQWKLLLWVILEYWRLGRRGLPREILWHFCQNQRLKLCLWCSVENAAFEIHYKYCPSNVLRILPSGKVTPWNYPQITPGNELAKWSLQRLGLISRTKAA